MTLAALWLFWSLWSYLELTKRLRLSSLLQQELCVVIHAHAPKAQHVLLVLAFIEDTLFQFLLLKFRGYFSLILQ